MSLLEECRAFYHENKLGRVFDTMESEARYTILADADPELEEDELGASRVGGEPDLPKEIEWPKSGGHSMAFIAQLNLEELNECFPNLSELPKEGILYFFRQDSEDADNFGLDAEGFIHNKVIHYKGDVSDLERRPYPDDLEVHERYSPASLDCSEFLTLPEEFSPFFDDNLEMTAEEDEAYYGIFCSSCDVKILGHPIYVQGSVEEEAQMSVCDEDSVKTLPNEVKAKIAAPFGRDEKEWRLLLSVDSIDECGMMWGDMGVIYFMITEEDLKNQRFDRVTCVFQCG